MVIPSDFIFQEWPYRAIVFILALLCFIVAASLYMNADMGVAPYDAIPIMAKKYILKHIPFLFVRMCYDFSAILIGVLCGGKPSIGIILMAFFLGPIITIIGRYLNRHVFQLS